MHLKKKRELLKNKFSKLTENHDIAEDDDSSTCDALQYILEEEMKSKMK